MKTTTIKAIRATQRPDSSFLARIIAAFGETHGEDSPLAFSEILKSNRCGYYDAVFAIESAPQYEKEWRLFAIWCARRVQEAGGTWQATHALNIAERFAQGTASIHQLESAYSVWAPDFRDGSATIAAFAAASPGVENLEVAIYAGAHHPTAGRDSRPVRDQFATIL